MTWAVVNSTGKSVQGMNLLLTSSTAQQSTPVVNKRDGLKTVTVDVLSGVVEARNVRGNSPIRRVACVILVFVRLTNAVYIKRSHPSSTVSTICIFILPYCLLWAVLTDFQRTARHRHFPRPLRVACL